jgi:hypothetical protein
MIRLACLAGLAAALVPGRAQACGHPDEVCDWEQPIPDFVELRSTSVPEDGGLILVVDDGIDVDAWSLEVVVYDALGIEIAGTLQSAPTFQTTTWRPVEPWRAGERYLVAMEIVTNAVDGPYPECAGFEGQAVVEITAALGVGAPPPVTIEESWSLTPVESLRTLVCCDAARPEENEFSDPSYGCSNPDVEIGWQAGNCVVGEGSGALSVSYHLALPNGADEYRWALRVLTENQTLVDPSRDLTVRHELTAPGCVRIEVLDRVLGVLHTERACHGDELADRLGRIPLEIAAELADECVGEPYVCEVASQAWDLQHCHAWPVQEGAPYLPEPAPPGSTPPLANSGCMIGDYDPPPLTFAIVGALGLILRRRRNPAGRQRPPRERQRKIRRRTAPTTRLAPR